MAFLACSWLAGSSCPNARALNRQKHASSNASSLDTLLLGIQGIQVNKCLCGKQNLAASFSDFLLGLLADVSNFDNDGDLW